MENKRIQQVDSWRKRISDQSRRDCRESGGFWSQNEHEVQLHTQRINKHNSTPGLVPLQVLKGPATSQIRPQLIWSAQGGSNFQRCMQLPRQRSRPTSYLSRPGLHQTRKRRKKHWKHRKTNADSDRKNLKIISSRRGTQQGTGGFEVGPQILVKKGREVFPWPWRIRCQRKQTTSAGEYHQEICYDCQRKQKWLWRSHPRDLLQARHLDQNLTQTVPRQAQREGDPSHQRKDAVQREGFD